MNHKHKLYEREGKALTNFIATLPEPMSDLANEITKDRLKKFAFALPTRLPRTD